MSTLYLVALVLAQPGLLLLLGTQVERVELLAGRQLTVISGPQALHVQCMRRPSDGSRTILKIKI